MVDVRNWGRKEWGGVINECRVSVEKVLEIGCAKM